MSIAKPIPAATPAGTLALVREIQSSTFIDSVFARVQDLFAGRYPGYQACDTKFHDLTHTLDATTCLARILKGKVTAREFELAVAAVLLHDSGYLKEASDTAGTGAKYTLTHVERSAQFAGKFLAEFGVTGDEVRLVQLAIRCTGLRVDMSKMAFRDERERLIGCALGTGDMLGQLASETYPHRLRGLYEEFREGGVPGYASAEDLMRKTHAFWDTHVQAMLNTQWGGVYRQFDYEPYFAAVRYNLDVIDRSL